MATASLAFSSFADGGMIRVAPGTDKGDVIKPGTFGSRSTFGLLPDPATNTLWLCSKDLSFLCGPGDAKGSALKAFGLETGEGELGAALPGDGPTICNDTMIGPDGAADVTSPLRPADPAVQAWMRSSG